MIARDFMTRDIITVSPSTKVKNLAMILIKNQISGAPVVNKNGKILGIVSEADIIAKRGKDAKAIMSKKIISVRQDTSLEEIAQLMMTHAIKRVAGDGRWQDYRNHQPRRHRQRDRHGRARRNSYTCL
jgi:Predicted transcriptional regulator, contains C-terminal CBS domains